MNGPKTTSALSPFDSQLRTLVGAARMSQKGQVRTHAPQQKSRYSITSSSAAGGELTRAGRVAMYKSVMSTNLSQLRLSIPAR
jgi:hypothetical protein